MTIAENHRPNKSQSVSKNKQNDKTNSKDIILYTLSDKIQAVYNLEYKLYNEKFLTHGVNVSFLISINYDSNLYLDKLYRYKEGNILFHVWNTWNGLEPSKTSEYPLKSQWDTTGQDYIKNRIVRGSTNITDIDIDGFNGIVDRRLKRLQNITNNYDECSSYYKLDEIKRVYEKINIDPDKPGIFFVFNETPSLQFGLWNTWNNLHPDYGHIIDNLVIDEQHYNKKYTNIGESPTPNVILGDFNTWLTQRNNKLNAVPANTDDAKIIERIEHLDILIKRLKLSTEHRLNSYIICGDKIIDVNTGEPPKSMSGRGINYSYSLMVIFIIIVLIIIIIIFILYNIKDSYISWKNNS